MARMYLFNLEEINRFISVVNIGVKPEILLEAVSDIYVGKTPNEVVLEFLPEIRNKLEEEFNNLTYKELASCFVDAMGILRRVTSGEFVWKVFCSSDQGDCKQPRSDYNKAFQSIRRYFKGIWAWNLERGGYSLPDSIRILLLYNMFETGGGRFGSAHLAAAKVYKKLVNQRAEYMEPDFSPFIIEYAFHAASATKYKHKIFPLWPSPEDKTRAIQDEIAQTMRDLREEKNLKEFLMDTYLANELVEKCIHRLEQDEEVMRVIDARDYERACDLIIRG